MESDISTLEKHNILHSLEQSPYIYNFVQITTEIESGVKATMTEIYSLSMVSTIPYSERIDFNWEEKKARFMKAKNEWFDLMTIVLMQNANSMLIRFFVGLNQFMSESRNTIIEINRTCW